MPPSSFSVALPETSSSTSGSGAKRKRRVGGSDDLNDRKGISDAKGEERLNIIIAISERVAAFTDSWSSHVTPAAKTAYISSIRPVYWCFTKHFKSDKVEFFKKWPEKWSIKKIPCDGGSECKLGVSNDSWKEE
jgi:hypothetical protein